MVLERKWFLILILGALQVLDFATTQAVLGLGGAESNPLMGSLVHHPWAFLMVKVGAVLFLAGLVGYIKRENALSVERCLTYVVILYLGIVSWNSINLIGAT